MFCFDVQPGALTFCSLQRGFTALIYASRNGHMEVVTALIAAGPDVTAFDEVVCESKY
jgi:ankyrin repeat protein